MKGIRFYEEFQDSHKDISDGNVVAVLLDTGMLRAGYDDPWYGYDCLAATFYHANSDVSGTTVCVDYLRNFCKRISEKRAREIHPRLFARLDQEDWRETN
jgi:hypothetical protein